MPFPEHPVFQKPADENAVIWRYMDFTKFADLLDIGALFFTRSDKFDDRFEGSYPEYNVKLRPQVYGSGAALSEEFLRDQAETSRQFRRYIAINCWHVNAYESAAMWRLYLKSDEGIAIRSTYAKLGSSLKPGKDRIYCGLVKYIDYETQWMPEGNAFYPFVHKRKSFAHENELRCVLNRLPISKDNLMDWSLETISDGVAVPVDLEGLISGIFVAPESPAWLRRLVESVARKYSINVPVTQSALAKEPVY